MSREIKFRLHCVETGQILAYEKFNTTLNWGYYWYDATLPEDDQICQTLDYFKHPHPLGKVVRVEFTGLKDKNGVEIYEGDILSVMVQEVTRENVHNDPFYEKGKKYHTGKKVKSIWTVEQAIHECFSGFRVYGINRRFSKGITKSVIFNSRATVIGNIYQNPELLK